MKSSILLFFLSVSTNLLLANGYAPAKKNLELAEKAFHNQDWDKVESYLDEVDKLQNNEMYGTFGYGAASEYLRALLHIERAKKSLRKAIKFGGDVDFKFVDKKIGAVKEALAKQQLKVLETQILTKFEDSMTPRKLSYEISVGTVDGIKVGWTLIQAKRFLPKDAELKLQELGVDIPGVSVQLGGQSLFGFTFEKVNSLESIKKDSIIDSIRVFSPKFKYKGVHVGMKVDKAAKILGPPVLTYYPEMESREYLEFPKTDMGIFFRVTAPRGLAGVYKGKTKSTEFRKDAKILLISVN
ncbi:hypothetical protein [Pseudobacteriovorax antillogorgiicola]|uniref:Uncharacterized protein n=1 Tax=Pseudobacteriovorax antillogorgiicola TaxID=1513793 RepID=A0A1Y6B9E9_9BACT|nr:hypothetical protein [Pseudobacteriovorax antillogorgiicola]TCS57559.1 hypothetical protein EDD56_103299 [Pseudobacteriovorax antillogorgiicola]SME99778.1 hypothetical protein SAMN06296036_10334 [Pseudobacteriovorax antillogorgiicola]